MKINIESSPPEIWIRIHFLEINRSPSLVMRILVSQNRFQSLYDKIFNIDRFLE
jgi:hypothetical protein